MKYGDIYKVVKATDIHYGSQAERAALIGKEVTWFSDYRYHPLRVIADGKFVGFSTGDLQFVRKSKQSRKALRTILTEVMTNHYPDEQSVADFAMRYTKAGVVFHLEKPCHAQLKRQDDDTGDLTDIALYLKSWWKRIKEDMKPAYLKYVQWILSESPWSVCFKTKTATIAVEKGVTMNTDRHVSELVGAAIALREGWEYQSQRLAMFQQIKDSGASGNVAYLVACFVSPEKDGEHSLQSLCAGHLVLNTEMEAKALLEFFRSGYVEGKAAIRKDATQTSFKVFDTITERGVPCHTTEEKDKISTYVNKILKPKSKGEGWNVRTIVTKESVQRLVEQLEKDMSK